MLTILINSMYFRRISFSDYLELSLCCVSCTTVVVTCDGRKRSHRTSNRVYCFQTFKVHSTISFSDNLKKLLKTEYMQTPFDPLLLNHRLRFESSNSYNTVAVQPIILNKWTEDANLSNKEFMRT